SRSGKGGAAFRRALDRLVLGIPVAGRLAADSQMFLLASSMSALLDQGTSMEKALGLSARAVSNSWLRQSLERIQGRLEKGVGLYEAANEEPSLPAYVKGWIGVGEQTASMDRVFDQLKGFYGDRLDESIERVTAAMEPVLIVTVGAVIIYVLYAFIIPVFGAFTTLI
ncbi:MAG: type II secretion system F family protein, partial [Spirochaetales bacterium]|nr:type II secretion system F family protein [Spirochaetales bacterium]